MTLVIWASLVSGKTVITPEENRFKAPEAPRSVESLIDEKSIKYGISTSLMRRIIRCESGGNPSAVGDSGNSFGLAQIHLPSHPSISKEEALDPEFATEFLAQNLSQGKGYMWTCWTLIHS